MNSLSSGSNTSSPPPFDPYSAAPSTAGTSPPPHVESDHEDHEYHDKEEQAPEKVPDLDDDEDKRFARLQYVLEKSAIYSQILNQRMEQDQERLKAKAKAKKAGPSKDEKKRGGKRLRVQSDSEGEESDAEKAKSKRMKKEDGQPQNRTEDQDEGTVFQQPALITGAKLKKYQLEGLQWMASLDQNGISGILADEMGLGKTLQTIAFSAYLREQMNTKPFLVVCPLSVLHNWITEYEKFAPKIPVCMYHGTPAERAELRRTVMIPPAQRAAQAKKRSKGRPSKGSTKTPQKKSSRKSGRLSKPVHRGDDGGDSEEEDEDAPKPDPATAAALEFPVVVTTYEMIIKDRVHLAQYDWGYIVVDEGHRLKNLDCRLMQEIKKYKSAGRMILTGTPLHNNLAELWALLNFVLPDIFNDVDAFQQWFNLPAMQSNIGSERSTQIIGSLHAILKPFLLRRLKSDVETSLPPKKEYILYAPLSIQQRETYDHVLDGTLRAYLIGADKKAEEEEKPPIEESESEDGKMKLRRRGQRKSYAVDGDDDEYFDMLEKGQVDERGVKKAEEKEKLHDLARQHKLKAQIKHVNNMKLQNTVMQLRKVCSHPFLFDWPVDPDTRQPILSDQLVNASGKMMVLDRLLRELFKRGHKVLIFSQFTTMLDIIEDWAIEFMGWTICRIDGSTSPLDRREQMEKFQNGGDAPDAPHLFLLSTRAGGLGINLTAADTVIFYDQDWNPQMDAQAQDRAHRIGQTRPVLIFRLVSAHTIETKIMQRATEKRKLEALVIAKGKFRAPAAAPGSNNKQSMAEMAASLLRLEGEKIDVVPNTAEGKANVLSDEDLEMLLDRSPEVFADRGKGWTSAGANGGEDKEMVMDGEVNGEPSEVDEASRLRNVHGRKAAFAVYQAPEDQGSDMLAKMLGEDVE